MNDTIYSSNSTGDVSNSNLNNVNVSIQNKKVSNKAGKLKNRWDTKSTYICASSITFSIIAIILSVFSICKSYPSGNLGFDYQGIIVGVLSTITAILIAWQVIQLVQLYTIEKKVDEKMEEYISQINKHISEINENARRHVLEIDEKIKDIDNKHTITDIEISDQISKLKYQITQRLGDLFGENGEQEKRLLFYFESLDKLAAEHKFEELQRDALISIKSIVDCYDINLTKKDYYKYMKILNKTIQNEDVELIKNLLERILKESNINN